jgi:hypothetical protein
MERVRSKDVLAVMGLLCVNEEFRAEFFANPRAAAKGFVGALTAAELQQIDDLGGYGEMPHGFVREAFVSRAQAAFGDVYTAYECPVRPCPKPKEDDGVAAL